ncbi:hypothetical protein GQ55_1G037400 [Panicum hallii var. hallii]|uniref:Uncharacterized protein n=1 Tax=Panicum hallii var. hallii TaxID=1504633 RepID=A0A2T7F1Y7_9POAL|nr:hypothetical protein GQ55_1G037400 [Panicum hallii var. hallii]
MTSERRRKHELGRAKNDAKHAQRKLADHEMLGLRKLAPPPLPPHAAGRRHARCGWTSRPWRISFGDGVHRSGSRFSGSHRSSLSVSFGCRACAGREVRRPAAPPRRRDEARAG